MRRLVGWISGALGGITAYRLLRRRPQVTTEPSEQGTPQEADERAEELRAKLAENRASDEPSPVEPGEPEEAVEERRERVHEEARAALDDMKAD